MEACTLFESQKHNRYLYDRNLKKVHYCHPLLHYMIGLHQQSINIREWLDKSVTGAGVEVEGLGHLLKEEVDYYYRKYLFLKENGYFTDIDGGKKLGFQLSEEKIKQLLANSKQVVFEVTDKCQMNCYYCGYGEFYQYYDKRERKNLNIDSAKTLLKYLLEFWNSPLNTSQDRNIFISFYGGEPLLNFPFIAEIVDYVNQLKALHNRFSFSLTTNGLLVGKYMDFFSSNNFYLLISLDGNEKNNAYRVYSNGTSAFKEILKNVKSLQKNFPDYFSKKVLFNAVLHNKNSVQDIYNFFKEHFSKIADICELNTAGIKDSQKAIFWKTFANFNESLHQSEDYSLIEKELFLKTPQINRVNLFLAYGTDFSFKNYKDLLYTEIEQGKVPTGTCLPFSRKIFLTVNGKILPCERVGHQYGLGTVTPDKVKMNFSEIAEKYNAYYTKMRKHCDVCFHSETCEQCVFNLNIEDDNPSCKGFMAKKDHSKYLSSIVSFIENSPETYSKIIKEAFID